MAAFSIRLLVGWIQHRTASRDGFILLVFGAGLFMASALVPEGINGGTLMGYRIGFLFWLVWMIWLIGEVERSRWSFARISLGVLFVVAALCQTARVWDRQKSIQPFLAELKSVSQSIPEETRVWPLVFNLQGTENDGTLFAPRNPFFSHAGLRFLDARKGQVAAIAYQGEVRHFATRFRNPESHQYFREGYDETPGAFDLQPETGDVMLLVGGGSKLATTETTFWKPLARESTEFGTVGAMVYGDK